jgi:hypothetical protein
MPVSGRFRLRMEGRRAFLPFEILPVDLPSERPLGPENFNDRCTRQMLRA